LTPEVIRKHLLDLPVPSFPDRAMEAWYDPSIA
jgi:hypothetical protein